MRYTLYTYSKVHFNQLFKDKEEQGIKLISLSQAPDKTQIDEHIEDGFVLEIDITSVIPLLRKSEENLYQFELYINAIISEELEFIIEEKYAEEALDFLYLIFDEIVALNSYSCDNMEKEDTIESRQNKIKKITDIDTNEIQELSSHINRSIVGHYNFKKIFVEKVRSFRIFNSIGEHKVLSVFLLGPSGVGKTEFAREYHRFFDSDTSLSKISFGNYSSKDSLNNLIGSPRGYIGSENGELPIKINRSPVGVILIDEFEKADEKVFNFFLELLEEGKFTSTQGEEFDLNGYVIFFTSNLNQKTFAEKLPPELRSRFDIISDFEHLGEKEKLLYLCNKLDQLTSKLEIEDTDVIKNDILLKVKSKLNNYSNLREINKLIRDEITKRIYTD